MLMVVFGAGASFDSCPTHPAPVTRNHADDFRQCRLPLGNDLFEERDLFHPILQRFPRALDVASYLRHLSNNTVEQVMERLRDQAKTYPRRFEQLAAVRYYLQVAIGECDSLWDRNAAHGVTNYKTLFDMIELRRKPDETVCLVTFNYDTMLDAALPTVGVQLRSIDEYISSKYKVIKVHGSVSWAREVESPVEHPEQVNDDQLVRILIEKAADLKLTDRYHLANQRPTVRIDPLRVAIPAIAIPVQTKGEFECPADHIATLRECLKDVTKLLVVGWQANDMHFLKLLHDGQQAMNAWVVAGGPENARGVIANLKRGLNRPGKLEAGAGGFTQFMFAEAETFLDKF